MTRILHKLSARGRFTLLCVVLTSLCACPPGLPGGGTPQIGLFDGAFRVAAPAGYCIDPQNVSQTESTAVVLIGRCRDGSASTAALVSVTIGEPGSGAVMAAGPEGLSAFFTSPEGLATLSRSGSASDVVVQKAVMAGPNFLLLLADRTSGTYWRAISGMKGRVITTSAIGTQDVTLTPEAGRAVLDATLVALRRANPSP